MSALPRSSGRVKAAIAAMAKAQANTVKSAMGPPYARRGGTISGAMMDAIRPKPAADPVPLPRKLVGYSLSLIHI